MLRAIFLFAIAFQISNAWAGWSRPGIVQEVVATKEYVKTATAGHLNDSSTQTVNGGFLINGSVGIGRYTYVDGLSMRNGGRVGFDYLATNGNSRRWGITNDTDAFGDFSILTESTQGGGLTTRRFNINPSGLIGIGTQSQTATLHTVGTSSTTARAVVGSTMTILAGDVFIPGGNSRGLIIQSSDGTCRRLNVADTTGALTAVVVGCPQGE